jgi:hypothetical protein
MIRIFAEAFERLKGKFDFGRRKKTPQLKLSPKHPGHRKHRR